MFIEPTLHMVNLLYFIFIVILIIDDHTYFVFFDAMRV